MPAAVGTGKHPRRNSLESYPLIGYFLPRLEERDAKNHVHGFQVYNTGTHVRFSREDSRWKLPSADMEHSPQRLNLVAWTNGKNL